MSGVLLWFTGRGGSHIGASGLIYGLAFFLFWSGIFKRYTPLIAISLLVAFLYGNLVWGMLPLKIDDPTSWEGHLSGAVAGFFLAVLFRKEGPVREVHHWKEEDEEDMPEFSYFCEKKYNMKHLIILGDGMADEPVEMLGGKTPLQAADKPTIDMLASKGVTGLFASIPEGFQPGSEIANLAVLGYDVAKVFEGRGSLEAASMGVELHEGDMAMRCNLICIENEKIKNHSAGHISNEEAEELIRFLQEKLMNEESRIKNEELPDGRKPHSSFFIPHSLFYPGISYRHLFVMKNGNKHLKCTPPHDVPGTLFADVMIQATEPDAQPTADYLNSLILRSQALLENHPVNLKRAAEGKDKANSIWLWSPGYKPQMKTLLDTYGLKSGAVISAVDLIKGIGVYAGLKPIEVEGATGLYDTNYEGKAQAAIDALRKDDFVYLHVEASDEAGHEGDVALKVKTIEYLDRRIVKPIWDEVSRWDEPVAIAILPDHPTPCRLKTHTSNPVPFIIYKPAQTPDEVQVYDEFSVKEGSCGLLHGAEFMDRFMKD